MKVTSKIGEYERGEKSGQQITDNTTDTMDGEDIEGIVGAHDKFELRGYVAADAADDAEDDSRPRRDVSGGRRDGHEARDGAGTEADDGPLPLEAVIEEDPGDAANGGREMGDDASHDGAKIRSKRGTAVETEPTDPEEHGTEDDVRDVVRPVR